jgi:hypothetical protein
MNRQEISSLRKLQGRPNANNPAETAIVSSLTYVFRGKANAQRHRSESLFRVESRRSRTHKKARFVGCLDAGGLGMLIHDLRHPGRLPGRYRNRKPYGEGSRASLEHRRLPRLPPSGQSAIRRCVQATPGRHCGDCSLGGRPDALSSAPGWQVSRSLAASRHPCCPDLTTPRSPRGQE